VEDTGVGIDESVRDHIFEPFFTTKSSSRGTGLGLATVYTAVDQNGGHVEMSTEVGVGTRFDVYLPVFDEAPESTELEPVADLPTGGSELVLLVEDDPAVQRVLREFLADRGYTVLAANDGLAGFELACREGNRVDLVVTDVVMPRMNGIELARRLRDELPHVKVLLISGYAKDREKIMEESLHGPNCWFLQKPFTPDTLARSIRELLDT
jgi:CheY-like chemotaxis protein